MNSGDAFATNYINDVLKIVDSAAKQSLQIVSPEEDEELA